MYLRTLRLTNIQCFEDVTLDFATPSGGNRKWTVLLGENGTGKSAILKSLGLILGGSDALTELVRDPAQWLRTGATTGAIRATLTTKEGETRELVLEFHRSDSASGFLARAFASLKPLNEALEHAVRNYPVFGYGSSRRLSTGRGDTQRRFSHPRANSMATLFDREAALNTLDQWAMQLDYASDGAQLGVVRAVLDQFLPELSFSHIDKAARTLIFDSPDGPVPLGQLSDGYQNIAGWVGDLLYQVTGIFDDYANPLQARGVLIIDEVDLHLHPKWQRVLLDFLDRQLPNMQLVVTTHSVVTAQQAPEGALHYTIRRNDRPVIEQFNGNPANFLLNQLMVTEAFGHVSDESVAMEQDKAEYRDLARGGASLENNPRMQAIADRIGGLPSDPAEDIRLSPRQQALLARMEEKLGTLKK